MRFSRKNHLRIRLKQFSKILCENFLIIAAEEYVCLLTTLKRLCLPREYEVFLY